MIGIQAAMTHNRSAFISQRQSWIALSFLLCRGNYESVRVPFLGRVERLRFRRHRPDGFCLTESVCPTLGHVRAWISGFESSLYGTFMSEASSRSTGNFVTGWIDATCFGGYRPGVSWCIGEDKLTADVVA